MSRKKILAVRLAQAVAQQREGVQATPSLCCLSSRLRKLYRHKAAPLSSVYQHDVVVCVPYDQNEPTPHEERLGCVEKIYENQVASVRYKTGQGSVLIYRHVSELSEAAVRHASVKEAVALTELFRKYRRQLEPKLQGINQVFQEVAQETNLLPVMVECIYKEVLSRLKERDLCEDVDFELGTE